MTAVIGAAIRRLRLHEASLGLEQQPEVERADCLLRVSERVAQHPNALRVIIRGGDIGRPVLPVGVSLSLIGPVDVFGVAICRPDERRCRQARRWHATRRCHGRGTVIVMTRRTPYGHDQQRTGKYQRERERQPAENRRPRHGSRASPVACRRPHRPRRASRLRRTRRTRRTDVDLRSCGLCEEREGLRAGNPVCRQAERALEPPNRSFGPRAVLPIDRAGGIARGHQTALQRTHEVRATRLSSRPWPQNDDVRAQHRQRLGTHMAVRLQAVGSLKCDECLLRARPKASIDLAGRIPRTVQLTLQRPDERRAAAGLVAAAQGQQRVSVAGAGRRCHRGRRKGQRERANRQCPPGASSLLCRGAETARDRSHRSSVLACRYASPRLGRALIDQVHPAQPCRLDTTSAWAQRRPGVRARAISPGARVAT